MTTETKTDDTERESKRASNCEGQREAGQGRRRKQTTRREVMGDGVTPKSNGARLSAGTAEKTKRVSERVVPPAGEAVEETETGTGRW